MEEPKRITKIADKSNDSSQASVSQKSSGKGALAVELLDGNGNQITTFGGTGGTSSTDGDAFSANTTLGTPAVGVYESTPSSLADGDLGIVGVTANRELKVSVTSGGTSGTQYDDGESTPVTPTGTLPVFDDAGTIRAVSDTNPLPVLASIDTTGLATETKQDSIITAIGAVQSDGLTDTELRATPVPISGTVTANLSATDNAVLDDIAAKDFATQTTLAALNAKLVTGTDIGDVTINNASGASAVNIQDGGNSITVDGTVTVTGVATATKQDTIIGHLDGVEGLLGTIDTDTGAIAASVATEGSALGSGVLMQGDDGTDRTNVLVDTSGHLQVDVLTMPAGGSGLTDAELRASPVVVDLGANNDVTVTSGTITANLGATDNAVLDQIELNQDSQTALLTTIDSDTSSLPTIKTNTDYGAVTGGGTETGALRVTIANNSTGVVSIDDNGGSLTVDGTVAVTGVSTAANQTTMIGHLDGVEGLLGTIDADTGGILASVQTIDNAISGSEMQVDVVAPLPAGTNVVGDVDIAPRTTGGWSVGNFNTGDTYTALTNAAQSIKGSAGKFGGYYIYNPNSTAIYVLIYDIASGSVTVGTSTPKLVFCIPPTAGANLELLAGIPFSTAMSIAAATTGGGNTAPTTALEAMIFYK